jgi:FAS-associated factor 2
VVPNNNANNANNNGSWNPLRWLFQTHPVSLNPELDTRRFLADFDMKFGSQHPQFSDSSYQNAVAQAFQNSRFLLVYIHSPMHEDTSRFCRQVLCTQTFSNFVDNEMMMWAGQVWDAEAYSLSIQLRATTFPFLALLVCQSDKVVQIVRRFQGKILV